MTVWLIWALVWGAMTALIVAFGNKFLLLLTIPFALHAVYRSMMAKENHNA